MVMNRIKDINISYQYITSQFNVFKITYIQLIDNLTNNISGTMK